MSSISQNEEEEFSYKNKENKNLLNKIFILENKLKEMNNDKEKTQKRISQLSLTIKQHLEEIENIRNKISCIKNENKNLETENSKLKRNIKEYEKEIFSMTKDLNETEKEINLLDKINKIDLSKYKKRKNNLINEINCLKRKLKEIKNNPKDIHSLENELIKTKKENEINEIKMGEYKNMINDLYEKINKNLFLISNWVEIYFGNNSEIFNKDDLPLLNDLKFINFDLLIDCLDKKRALINSNSLKLNNQYKELKQDKGFISKKIDELQKNNELLEAEIEKCNLEKININEGINKLYKKLNLFNDGDINESNKNLNELKGEKNILNNSIQILKNNLNNIKNYNSDLKDKIKEIENIKKSIDNNYKKKMSSIKNELNVIEIEREVKMKKFNEELNECENENNKIKIENEILQIKIRNIKTELEIKNNRLNKLINNFGEFNKKKYNTDNEDQVLIKKLKFDNNNLFNENISIAKENIILQQKIKSLLKNKF